MPGNIKDAELAASIHVQECYRSSARQYGTSSNNRHKYWIGSGSYRCSYRIRGVVYKVEHKWLYGGDCNKTEFENACVARALHISIVPRTSQFKVRVRNRQGTGLTRVMLVNAMPFYRIGSDKHRWDDWCDKVEAILKNTPLAHLTWDLGGSNIKFTPTGQPRIVDAANQCN